MADVAGFKSYLRYDPEDEVDSELHVFVESAKAYVAGAGLPVQNGDNLYDLLIYMIAQHWFDNRGVIADAYRNSSLPLGATNILIQLKLRYSL